MIKKYLIPATLLAMISVASVSCQKENPVESISSSNVETSSTRTIHYIVNGSRRLFLPYPR